MDRDPMDMNLTTTEEEEEFEVYEEGDARATGVAVATAEPVREAAAVISPPPPPPPPTQQGKKRKAVSFADSVDVKWYLNTRLSDTKLYEYVSDRDFRAYEHSKRTTAARRQQAKASAKGLLAKKEEVYDAEKQAYSAIDRMNDQISFFRIGKTNQKVMKELNTDPLLQRERWARFEKWWGWDRGGWVAGGWLGFQESGTWHNAYPIGPQ